MRAALPLLEREGDAAALSSSLERAVPQLVTDQTLLPRLVCFHQYQARVRTHGNDSANAVSVEINVVNCGIQAQPECRT